MVRFCLVFERELLSVPVMRRVLGDTLRGIGLNEESVDDILLAATDACTNVVLHAGQSDSGLGCSPRRLGHGSGALAESGRGFEIMQACVDAVTLSSTPGEGTHVVLDKRISWPGQLV